MAAIGLTFGSILALASAWQLRARLFGVHEVDPLAIASALALVTVATLIASVAPALRAAQLSPLEALRDE